MPRSNGVFDSLPTEILTRMLAIGCQDEKVSGPPHPRQKASFAKVVSNVCRRWCDIVDSSTNEDLFWITSLGIFRGAGSPEICSQAALFKSHLRFSGNSSLLVTIDAWTPVDVRIALHCLLMLRPYSHRVTLLWLQIIMPSDEDLLPYFNSLGRLARVTDIGLLQDVFYPKEDRSWWSFYNDIRLEGASPIADSFLFSQLSFSPLYLRWMVPNRISSALSVLFINTLFSYDAQVEGKLLIEILSHTPRLKELSVVGFSIQWANHDGDTEQIPLLVLKTLAIELNSWWFLQTLRVPSLESLTLNTTDWKDTSNIRPADITPLHFPNLCDFKLVHSGMFRHWRKCFQALIIPESCKLHISGIPYQQVDVDDQSLSTTSEGTVADGPRLPRNLQMNIESLSHFLPLLVDLEPVETLILQVSGSRSGSEALKRLQEIGFISLSHLTLEHTPCDDPRVLSIGAYIRAPQLRSLTIIEPLPFPFQIQTLVWPSCLHCSTQRTSGRNIFQR